MKIKFGPAGLGPVKTAEKFLEQIHSLGLRACEISFTYSVYIKDEKDMARIKKKAEELGIYLSIHAPYFVNLNSSEPAKRQATKERILNCCEVGEKLGAKVVVFHPGYYGDDRVKAYEIIRDGVKELMDEIRSRGWKIKIAPETMGKINVFGSIEEISRLVKDTGCSFCIDFAHILARDKEVDYSKVEELFPSDFWHVHFSGIIYGEKGEKKHRETRREEWEDLLKRLPKGKEVVIINEAPDPFGDSVEGLKIFNGK